MPSDGALRPAEGTARPARPSRGCRERTGLLCQDLLCSFPSQLGLYKNLEQETPYTPRRKGLNRCQGDTLCSLDLRMQKGRIPPITLKKRLGLGFKNRTSQGKGTHSGPASLSPGLSAEVPLSELCELKFRRGTGRWVIEQGGSLPQKGPQATPKDDFPLSAHLKIHRKGMSQ